MSREQLTVVLPLPVVRLDAEAVLEAITEGIYRADDTRGKVDWTTLQVRAADELERPVPGVPTIMLTVDVDR